MFRLLRAVLCVLALLGTAKAATSDLASSTSPGLAYTVKPAASGGALVEPVGTTSPVQTATVFGPGTFASIAVLTQGTPGLDFNLAPGGSCSPGFNYSYGTSCTVNFTFTPLRPGVRMGAITLLDSSGTPIATTYIQGTGTGPQLNFTPGILKTLPIALQTSAYSMAVDAVGNLYLLLAVSYGSPGNVLLKETPNGSGGYTQTVIASGFAYPTEVAVDGAGNLYVEDQDNEVVYKETLVNGTYVESNPFGQLGVLSGVAVDGSGNVYIASELLGLLQEVYSNGTYNGGRIAANGNYSIAVDGNGVIYCGDGTTYTPQAGGGYTQGTFPGGFEAAVDDLGNVFSSTQFATTLYKYIPFGGSYQSLPLGTFASQVHGLTLDGSGNLFFSTGGQIMELDFADPHSLTFATTAVGSTSADSPQQVTIYNEGNAPLVFTAPASGVNPSITPGFSIGGSSTCPQTVTSMLPFTLASGASCTFEVSFSPVAPGADSGQLILADNNLNVPTATQIVPLNGAAPGSAAAPTVTNVSPSSGPSSGGTTVTITGTNFSGTTAVIFGVSPATSFTVNSPTSITAVSPAGTSTVDVSVTTPGGISALSPSDQFTYITNTQTIIFPQPATPAYVGTSVLLTATGGPSGSPVVFTVVSGPALVSGLNGSTLTYTGPGVVVIEADQAAGAGYPAAAPVQVTVTATLLTEPVGANSGPIATLVTFQTAGTLGSVRSSTEGFAGQDFYLATGGTCNLFTTYAAGQTCVQEFLFTPKHPGQRFGGIVFSTASGTVLATTYLFGVGTGPQVTFSPGNQIALLGAVSQPAGISVDGTGDVFVATVGTGLYEIPVAGLPHQIGSFPNCQDVTVDGVGNVFVLVNKTTLAEVLAVNGTIPATPTIVTISTQFNNLTGVKVDGLGNVYLSSIASGGYAAGIYKVLSVNGSIPPTPTIQTISTPLTGPTGIAIDASGNLYVSDEVANAAFEVMAVNGIIPASPVIRTLASGLTLPSNIALDAAGDVFVSDYGLSDVKEILAVNGTIPATNPTILSLGSGLVAPQGLFVDQSGNVFVADAGLPNAVELDYADPPTLTFAPTIVGQTSTDSPQTVTLGNDGNAPLIFATPASGSNPAITPGFTIGGSSTCPQLGVSSATAQLAPSTFCTDVVSFTPVTSGNISGKLVSTDNALNLTGATQTVPLNAVALSLTVPTITFNVPNQTLGTPPFIVAAVSNSPGAITYSVLSGPATISGSTVTLTGAGIVTLQASQAPSGTYAAGTATATFTVAKQPQTITFVQPASPVPVGTLTLVATATSGLPVTFTVVSGPATISGAILTLTAPGTVVVAANQPGNAQYAAAPTVTAVIVVYPQPTVSLSATPNPVFLSNPLTLTATLSAQGPAPTGMVTFLDGTQPIGTATLNGQTAALVVSTLSLGTHTITAIYGGNTNYASASSPPVVVTFEDFALTMLTPTVTIFHGGTATFLLSLTATNGPGMASTVTFAANGEPEGSTLTFTPASVPTGSGTTSITLVIQTPNYPSGPWQVAGTRGGLVGGTALSALLFGAGFLFPRRPNRRRWKLRLSRVCGALLLAIIFAGLSGCGSGWRTQAWTIQVTATSGQLSHSVSGTLTSECRNGQTACQP